jgi:hypothetical protein
LPSVVPRSRIRVDTELPARRSDETARIDDTLSLPVIWSEGGGAPRPGRLDLSPRGLTLAGGSRVAPEQREIALGEIGVARIGRHARDRVGGRAALVLALRDGRTINVASLSTIGTLHELAERLWHLLGRPPELEPEPDPA